MNLFTDYRAVVDRVAVGPMYDGLDAIEAKVFKKDRARMKLKAIPPSRRRVLYGLEKELDPDLQQLQRDDPRAYYQDDRKLSSLHVANTELARHQRQEDVASTSLALLNGDPTAFKHKGDGVLKVKKTGTYGGERMEAGDILVPVAGGRLKNIGALKLRMKRNQLEAQTNLALGQTDAKIGYYSNAGAPGQTRPPVGVGVRGYTAPGI